MRRRRKAALRLGMLAAMALGGSQIAFDCGGDVGTPCIPEDEYRRDFRGFSETEVNVESRSFQCATRVCLVANFRGRTTCPYGQPAAPTDPAVVDPSTPLDRRCWLPGTSGESDADRVDVPVEPQLVERPATDAAYCSCRCAGPDPNARYCECPSGFSCVEVVSDLGLGSAELAGSYCTRNGTQVGDPAALASGASCDPAELDCGAAHPH